MRNTTIIRGAAILLALLVATDTAQARIYEFNGTRQQVRAACTGAGASLNEGASYTSCGKGGKGVICYDGGKCLASGRRGLGAWGIRSKDYQPPQSLVDTGGSSGGAAVAPSAPVPSAPAPSAPTGPIYN